MSHCPDRFGAKLRRRVSLILALCLILFSSACFHRRRRPRRIPPAPPVPSRPQPGGKTPTGPVIQGEEGIASWYGHPFHGRRTSSGEVYNMYALTAAHRTLPFGTRVRVHNLQSGLDVIVRINDRGPFVEGRIIDLSYAAAQAIHMSGIARVRLEILGYGATQSSVPPPGSYAVQVGAFKDPRNAENLRDRIARAYSPVSIQRFETDDGVYYRVLVGRTSSEEEAQRLANKLREANFAAQTFIVRAD
jgi:peptidoglycan lytic transglycosylase